MSAAPTCLRILATRSAPAKVDREHQVIRGVSVITRGEALGHEHWVDSTMLSRIVELGNAAMPRGIKSRWTHPGLSADGLGTHLGRLRNFRLDGDRALADLHLSDLARQSPTRGDMAGYVLGLAEEDPESFGLSITFQRDEKAEKTHRLACGGENFLSSDERNLKNLPHFSIAQLKTADVVDDPAANPGGFLTAHE